MPVSLARFAWRQYLSHLLESRFLANKVGKCRSYLGLKKGKSDFIMHIARLLTNVFNNETRNQSTGKRIFRVCRYNSFSSPDPSVRRNRISHGTRKGLLWRHIVWLPGFLHSENFNSLIQRSFPSRHWWIFNQNRSIKAPEACRKFKMAYEVNF